MDSQEAPRSAQQDVLKEAQRLVKQVAKAVQAEDHMRTNERMAELTAKDVDRAVQAEALLLLTRKPNALTKDWVVGEKAKGLLERSLPLAEEHLISILGWSGYSVSFGLILKAVERYAKDAEVTPALRSALEKFRRLIHANADAKKLTEWSGRVGMLLGEEAPTEVPLRIADAQPWAARVVADLGQLKSPEDAAMRRLLAHASSADGGKPTQKWSKLADELASDVPEDLLRSALCVWGGLFDVPAEEEVRDQWIRSVWTVPSVNADLMKGLLWLTPRVADEALIRVVSAAGVSAQRKIPELGPRASKVTNAAVWALGSIDHPLAIAQLAILRSRIRNKSVQKQIDKAMAAVAERLGVSESEVEELAVPTFGLTGVGELDVTLGDFSAELRVESGSCVLRWRKGDGKIQKSVPKAVRESFADELKDLKATAKDVDKLLPSQRDRLDRLELRRSTWPFSTWRERYLDHVLVGTLARRLIWTVTNTDGEDRRSVTWLDGELVDHQGAPAAIDPELDEVALWHPVRASEEDVLGWRSFFENREITQPFKQAHREVYLLTDAERTTEVYSNRFAAHILKQHQCNALCAVRGWKNTLRLMVDDDYPPALRELSDWGVRAEFWIEGIGDDYGTETTDAGTYLYLSTDQVRFYPIDTETLRAHASGGGYRVSYGAEEVQPIRLEELDPLVFSEVMRDVDLFVGVASVGNDPQWADGGGDTERADYWSSYSFGELSATATTRKEQLERLVPRLKIADRCSFEGRFLVVRGDLRTYKIHLGSGNILMEPTDQYLCIVPGRGAVKGPAAKVFLPFEGDRTLSIILSKAFLLAEDRKIDDVTILSQIRA